MVAAAVGLEVSRAPAATATTAFWQLKQLLLLRLLLGLPLLHPFSHDQALFGPGQTGPMPSRDLEAFEGGGVWPSEGFGKEMRSQFLFGKREEG